MAQAIAYQPMNARDRAWYLAIRCGFCGGQNGSEVFSPRLSIYSCRYHSQNTPTHLSVTDDVWS